VEVGGEVGRAAEQLAEVGHGPTLLRDRARARLGRKGVSERLNVVCNSLLLASGGDLDGV
jgi:hypothetical protein